MEAFYINIHVTFCVQKIKLWNCERKKSYEVKLLNLDLKEVNLVSGVIFSLDILRNACCFTINIKTLEAFKIIS